MKGHFVLKNSWLNSFGILIKILTGKIQGYMYQLLYTINLQFLSLVVA